VEMDFGGARAASEAVGLLYAALCARGWSGASKALAAWRERFALAAGAALAGPTAAVRELAAALGMDRAEPRPAELWFALQTYVAQVAQHLAGAVLGRDARPLLADSWFAWPAAVRSAAVRAWLRDLDSRANSWQLPPEQDPIQGYDLLGGLYQGLVPRRVRHKMGEYYTPRWLAEHVLDEVGYRGDPHRRLLDPACGSGVFLLAAIRRVRPRAGSCEAILAGVVGYELSPLAALLARANYLMAIRDLLPRGRHVDIPVLVRDAILEGPPAQDPFDFVVGNPPWIAWDHLPPAYREATKPLWERYGLFSLSARDARHGGAKKDLAGLVTYASADRYLCSGGRLGMVVPQTLFQTKGAGEGFRRFRLGADGPPLQVLRVNDLVAVRPFAPASNWTATLVLQKGRPTQYPVPYVQWLPRPGRSPGRRGHEAPPVEKRLLQAQPADPDRPASAWLLTPARGSAEGDSPIFADAKIGTVPPEPTCLMPGRSDYTAHLGANTGGANGVYWVRLLGVEGPHVLVESETRHAKHAMQSVRRPIEPDLIYPLLRWGDVDRWRATPSGFILLAQDPQTRRGIDPDTLAARWPRTLAYLERFRELLQRRAAYRRYQAAGPFWSMYNVGPYTLAPIKVVWRRMERRIRAAVVAAMDVPGLGPRPVIPQETCSLVAVEGPDEAHYLCAMLNSGPIGRLAESTGVRGGKGFGSPGMLDFLAIPRYDPSQPLHREIARCGHAAHWAAAEGKGEGDSAAAPELDELVLRIRPAN